MSAPQLGDLQLAIMQILWDRGEAAVADVYTALQDERGLALTTIATMLVKMEQRELVEHRSEGRRYLYRPLLSEEEVRRSMVGDLRRRLFRGDAAALVSHLIEEHEIDAEDLGRLRALIAAQQGKEE
jgi:BlaI family transcriptional regulator, penicillinase repressor